MRGAIFFISAGAVGLFSLFFFFLMIGEILDIWLPRWAAFTIVFFLMVVMAGALAFLGYRKVKQTRQARAHHFDLERIRCRTQGGRHPCRNKPRSVTGSVGNPQVLRRPNTP